MNEFAQALRNTFPALSYRRAAALRELASLGFHAARAGRMIGMESGSVKSLSRRFALTFPPYEPEESPLRAAVREGYANGERPSKIAARLGKKTGLIRVTATKMGITGVFRRGREPRVKLGDTVDSRRGFKVPPDRLGEYRELRSIGLTVEECGWNMGLLARPAIAVPARPAGVVAGPPETAPMGHAEGRV